MVKPSLSSNSVSTATVTMTTILSLWNELLNRGRRLGIYSVMFGIAALCTIIFLLNKNGGDSSNNYDIYEQTPMCSPKTGICGEPPNIPTPRTIYSAKSKKQYDLWWTAHEKLKQSTKTYVDRRKRMSNDPIRNSKKPLIFLGDSITEEYLGTNMGEYDTRWNDVPDVLQDIYTSNFDPLVLAIGGDQTQHLLWRIQSRPKQKNLKKNRSGSGGNELLNDTLRKNKDVTFVLLIGTNNIGSGALPKSTTKGIMKIVEYIMKETYGKLILVELLPRGDNHRLERLCPPRCNSNSNEPYKSFMPAINKVNNAIKNEIIPHIRKTIEHSNNRFHLVNCGSIFLLSNSTSISTAPGADEGIINIDLMPDKLHPNAKGHRLLSQCIYNCIMDVNKCSSV